MSFRDFSAPGYRLGVPDVNVGQGACAITLEATPDRKLADMGEAGPAPSTKNAGLAPNIRRQFLQSGPQSEDEYAGQGPFAAHSSTIHQSWT